MAQPPITFLERKWAASYGSGNSLVRAATQTSDRKTIPMLDYDVYRNVSVFGRRTLQSLGRYVFENISPIRGAVMEKARLSASTFIPQFAGENQEWGSVAEDHLIEEDRFIDIREFPFNMATFRRNLVIALERDGEMGVIFADVNGEPKLQCIPSHRIGSRSGGTSTEIVQGGPYDGAKLIDGCIVDDYAATMAYRVYDERGMSYQDISANDMLLVFIPDYPEQLRGRSPLGIHAFEAWDITEGRNFELIAQKIRASFPVVIKNETGMVDTAKQVFAAKATANDSSTNAAQTLPSQIIQPGQMMYMKAGTGQGLEFPTNDNPGPNVMAFQEEVLRSILNGLGWSYDFSHKPILNGAPMRVVVDKINAAIAEIQSLALAPTCRRINGWRISKAIKNGRLPEETEWYKWDFQGPAEITSDEKYASDVIIQEIRAGIRSPQKGIERMGGFWEDVQDEAIAFEKRFQERCKAEGVDPERVILLTPNGNPVGPNAQKEKAETNQKDAQE